MARLIEFKKTEAELFEALSVVFFVTDQPTPAENKASIKAEDMFEKYGIPAKESKFKDASCGFCGSRLARMPRIYTFKEDSNGVDLILEDKIFDYIESRFDKWQIITSPALKRPFETLRERFEKAKNNKDLSDYDQIAAYIKSRDTVVVSKASTTAAE